MAVPRPSLTTACVVIMMLSIASCGGSDGDTGAAAAKPAASSASAAPASPADRQGEAAGKSLKQVESDLRFATAPHGDLHVQERPPGACILHATVPTAKVLGNTAMTEVVARLRSHGWTPNGPVEQVSDNEDDGNLTRVTSGDWDVTLGAAPIPPELKEAYAPDQGTIVIGALWPCKGSSSALPSPTARP
ncbi:hypothetical protein [Streptomyces sp. enrichment culture]|uniref:hypothetical protein n=1 Tax=Streptomyces sp. enrichment culture TaxID=1795815 RepID=UPI003F545FC3